MGWVEFFSGFIRMVQLADQNVICRRENKILARGTCVNPLAHHGVVQTVYCSNHGVWTWLFCFYQYSCDVAVVVRCPKLVNML